jgi:hypothetical protein
MKPMGDKPKGAIRVGRPDVDPEAPSHVAGVHEGNDPKKQGHQEGARRSTGISADEHDPIDPRMPKLTPP